MVSSAAWGHGTGLPYGTAVKGVWLWVPLCLAPAGRRAKQQPWTEKRASPKVLGMGLCLDPVWELRASGGVIRLRSRISGSPWTDQVALHPLSGTAREATLGGDFGPGI